MKRSFWNMVADLMRLEGGFGRHGLADAPTRTGVKGLDDLAAMVRGSITVPVNIVAQSMGGLIAINVALAAPKMVNRLVLVVTSSGIPVADLGGSNWRSEYYTAYPRAASWIADPTEDLSERIPTIEAPTPSCERSMARL